MSNILVSGSDIHHPFKVRLADLGCAVRLDCKTAKRTYKIGTPGYIPPEALKFGLYGLKYDIWSLGALMYALIARKTPFYDKNDKIRERRVCTEQLFFNSKPEFDRIGPLAKNLLTGMLKKN